MSDPLIDPPKTDLQRRDDLKFQADLDALLKEAERMRLSYMHKHRSRQFTATTLGLVAVVAGAGGFGWFFFMKSNLIKGLACVVLSLAIPLLLSLWSRTPLKAYKDAHKTHFMPQMADLLGGFRFTPKRGISANILGKTGVVPAHKTYHAEDCFTGRHKGIKVMFSEARLTGEHRHAPALFRGLFVVLELPQPVFEGHTIITADSDMVARYAATRWHKLAPVMLDNTNNPAHDKFVAYSDKPEDAKLILGARLIKELAEAMQIFDGAKITAVLFRKKYVFMMIPHEANMFEASDIFFPVTTKAHALRCKKEIEQLLEIIDVFDLYGSHSGEIKQ